MKIAKGSIAYQFSLSLCERFQRRYKWEIESKWSWNGYMFILSEETSTKQIFEQTLSLIVFYVVKLQREEYKIHVTIFTDTTNYRNWEKFKKISKTTYT